MVFDIFKARRLAFNHKESLLSSLLTVLSSSFAVYTLFKKYKAKKIDKKRFIYLSTKITGLKAAKITSILALLSLPVIGQVTAVFLISKLKGDA